MEYKEKNFVYYSLDMTVFDEMIMWFKGFTGDRKEEAGQAKAGKCEGQSSGHQGNEKVCTVNRKKGDQYYE